MADALTSQHAQAKRLILHIRDGLERLEASESHQRGPMETPSTSGLAGELRTRMAELQRISHELESQWRMYVIRENSAKRDVWKRKVEQVTEEAATLRRAIDKFGTREQRRQAEKEDREELLSRADTGRRAKNEMDEEAAMSGSVQRSKRALEEMFDTGAAILSNMGANRERLKRAHRKVLDVLNSLGMGETLLRIIERRQKTDIWIAYGGMAALLLFTVLLLWWALR